MEKWIAGQSKSRSWPSVCMAWMKFLNGELWWYRRSLYARLNLIINKKKFSNVWRNKIFINICTFISPL